MGTLRQVTPHAREEGLVVQEMPGELLVYDLNRHKAHCLNQQAAFIWKQCDGATSVTEIAARLGREFNAASSEETVWLALDQFNKTNLLRGRVTRASNGRRVSRREMIRKAGLTAAVGIPLVTSLLAPKAMAQASCVPRGGGCTTNTECCSGNCRGNGLCA